MRRVFVGTLIIMLMCTFCRAETITINIDTATEQEINDLIKRLQEEKTERIIERLAEEPFGLPSDGLITFRDIPWYTSRTNAEKILGKSSSSNWMSSLFRLSYIDYQNISWGGDTVEGDLGCRPYYNGLTVAGYTPSDMYLCFMFPIVDDLIIRDISVAQLYMGYYTFTSSDFGDIGSVYLDLEEKLTRLYGEGESTVTEYSSYIIWQDIEENKIRLKVDSNNTYLTLAYIAGDADSRIDELAQALALEKKKVEDQIRIENENNVGGL